MGLRLRIGLRNRVLIDYSIVGEGSGSDPDDNSPLYRVLNVTANLLLAVPAAMPSLTEGQSGNAGVPL